MPWGLFPWPVNHLPLSLAQAISVWASECTSCTESTVTCCVGSVCESLWPNLVSSAVFKEPGSLPVFFMLKVTQICSKWTS